jgi:transcriptional regulator with XRE-family HTH domain
LDIKIGRVAKEIREAMGLSQRQAADALGITNVHLSNIENDKSEPSVGLLDKYRELWGVDLYVFAWCRHGDVSKLPPEIRHAASRLTQLWTSRVEKFAS